MTKQEQKDCVKRQLLEIGEKSFIAIEQFPEGNNWGEILLMGMIKNVIEFDPPIDIIVKDLKRKDPLRDWKQDKGEEYTFQKEVKK